MDIHCHLLASLCRLCGTKFKDKEKTKAKGDLSRDLDICFGLKVLEDTSNVYPSLICHPCVLKMTKWRKNKNKKKETKQPSIKLFDFMEHRDNCSLCNERQWDAEVIHGLCVQKKLISWITDEKVVCVMHDKFGERVVKRIIFEDGNVTVYLMGKLVEIMPKSPSELLDFVSELTLCTGITGFTNIADANRGGLRSAEGEFVAHVEDEFFSHGKIVHNLTIRHTLCEGIGNPSSALCSVCNIYKGTLHAKESVARRKQGKAKGKFTRNDYLSKSELLVKVTTLSQEKKALQQRTSSLKKKVEQLIADESLQLEEEDKFTVDQLVMDCADELERCLPPDSHCRLLWEEQAKARERGPKQMRWHPAIIKWAIAVHSKSSSANSVLRNSGFLRLPHPNTLRTYTHFTDPDTGVNPNFLQYCLEDLGLSILERPAHEHQINVIFDEMKIKSGLGFSVKTGKILGFMEVGEVSSLMAEFEEKCAKGNEDHSSDTPQMASHVLLFMARGITSSYKFPVSYFGTNNVTAAELYPVAMDCVEALTVMGLTVKCLTSDGASSNRKFFSILGGDKDSQGQPKFKSVNCFSESESPIFFMCDVPRLMKTTRNNFENSGWNCNTRKLKFRGKDMTWNQLLRLYEWDQGIGRPAPGLQLLPKLTYEHLHLTPSLRMRVKLAVQVLSSSVAHGLEAMKKPRELESTIHFIRTMDKCFDILNVANKFAWQKKRNINLQPFSSIDDPRFSWLIHDFLGFLAEWRAEGEGIPNLTKKERQKLCLSRETIDGFYISVNSFVEVSKELLGMEGVEYVLSDKFNQDPIEEFFGKQRGAGGSHDNPSLEQFGHSLLRNVVAGSRAVASSKGNVRLQEGDKDVSDAPMPKRKRTGKHV